MAKATEPVTTIPTRRTLLAGAPVAAAAALAAGTAVNSIAAAVAASSPPDPIFVAIAAYRAAVKAYSAACEADEDEDDEDLVHDTGVAHKAALEELLACRPTTLPGVVALLDLLAEPDHGHDPEYTLLAGAIGWDGDIKAAAMKLPAVLAGVISRNIMAGGQS
jgi:hypothetical protein